MRTPWTAALIRHGRACPGHHARPPRPVALSRGRRSEANVALAAWMAGRARPARPDPHSGVPPSARRRDRALGHHADEMGAIVGVGVDVGVEARRRRSSTPVERGGARNSRRAPPPSPGRGTRRSAPAPVTATRTPPAVLATNDADQRVARGRVGELHIGRLLRDRERDLGDDFARLERGLEQALERSRRRRCGACW